VGNEEIFATRLLVFLTLLSEELTSSTILKIFLFKSFLFFKKTFLSSKRKNSTQSASQASLTCWLVLFEHAGKVKHSCKRDPSPTASEAEVMVVTISIT
jgi:hypothetical protein